MRSKRLELQEAQQKQKKKLSTTKSSSASVNGSWANEIVSIAADASVKAVALKKKRLSTTKPSSAFVNGIRENEIATDPVDERLIDDMPDAGGDIRDEDTDRVDSWSDARDEDAGTLDTGRDARDEDADILYGDGNGEMQFAEDQSLPTKSDENADMLGANERVNMQFVEDQLLPTNSDKVAGSSRKRKRDMVQRQVTDPHSESNNANCTDNGQGSTSMPSGMRKLVIFDKYGRPCDVGSEVFATDIGRIVRVHCPPAIESWTKVPNSMKENIWKDIVMKYVVPEIYKPSVLLRANKAYKNWKRQLRVELDKHETIAERKRNMPKRMIKKREDWESFVDFCNTDEDRKRRAIGKKAREGLEFLHSCGRKGIHRKIYDLEKESPTGEVTRAAIFLDTHISKKINDPESSSISDIKMRLIKELVEANPDGQKDIGNDAVTLVCGRDTRGVVLGMGGGVSITKVRASAASVETLRKVQQENKSLQSDIHLLRTQYGLPTPNHTSTLQTRDELPAQDYTTPPYTLSASDVHSLRTHFGLSTPAHASTPSNQSASDIHLLRAHYELPTQNHTFTPSNLSAPHTQNRTCRPSNQSASQAPGTSNLPGRSRLAPDLSNLPVRTRLAPNGSNSPVLSRLAPPASSLPASSCFIKNFKGKTIALGSINTADPPMENVHSLIIEEIFDRNAELFDQDGKLGDILIGGVITWPKACVVSNFPASSCFIRNFKRRIIAFGNFNTADPPMEDVYSVIVKEIYDKDAELFDEDGKLGDIMIGGVINWPKACVKPC
ncbi:hypothetical protein C5167_024822 [Papaver somniferum]|uniref:Transposase Tnp1/En/Spm-like domain-containing protein n=1 Tax=Papaver somniferum TaxID=3469 RepID=A0A4Y7JRA8_PAPSO|nr:uncharacterized protein LOC113283733 [Papaver somniferum]XP_026388855.1 uncharacterized protein LOC113283733 [Papaver somniferum]RZC63076.1 hypothetical protein C5167_024822 [Papaver somniferum]